jgi:hypothetical protein
MSGNIEPLILDLVEWIAKEPRPYEQVMDIWRTSCPRLTVWEDAVDRSLLRAETSSSGLMVVATREGLMHLEEHGRLPKDYLTLMC